MTRRASRIAALTLSATMSICVPSAFGQSAESAGEKNRAPSEYRLGTGPLGNTYQYSTPAEKSYMAREVRKITARFPAAGRMLRVLGPRVTFSRGLNGFSDDPYMYVASIRMTPDSGPTAVASLYMSQAALQRHHRAYPTVLDAYIVRVRSKSLRFAPRNNADAERMFTRNFIVLNARRSAASPLTAPEMNAVLATWRDLRPGRRN